MTTATPNAVYGYVPDPAKVLLERHDGIDVYVSHDPESDTSALAVREGDAYRLALIPADRLMDAFAHPFVYLGWSW